MLEYLGLVLVLISWILAAALIFKWRDKDLDTISRHGATTRKAALFFLIALIGLGVPFYYWILHWLVPHLGLGAWFEVVIAIALVLNIATAVITDTLGWRRHVHRVTAFGMAILFLPISLLVLLAPATSNLAQVIGWVLMVYMLASFIMVAMLGAGKRHYLIFQTFYLVSWQCILLSAAYIS